MEHAVKIFAQVILQVFLSSFPAFTIFFTLLPADVGIGYPSLPNGVGLSAHRASEEEFPRTAQRCVCCKQKFRAPRNSARTHKEIFAHKIVKSYLIESRNLENSARKSVKQNSALKIDRAKLRAEKCLTKTSRGKVTAQNSGRIDGTKLRSEK